MEASVGQPTKRQQQGIASREHILDAAERLMATRGVTGTSMSALTKACGLPASSIYWHFGSKDGVVLAVMERGARRFFAQLAPGDSFTVTGAERVRQQLADTARTLEAHGNFLHVQLTLLLVHPEGNDAADAVIAGIRRVARDRIVEMIVQAYADELLSPERIGRQLADFILGAIDGAFLAYRSERDIDLHAVFAQLARAIDALVRGVADA
jgi:AcrR family transcriptional regulator